MYVKLFSEGYLKPQNTVLILKLYRKRDLYLSALGSRLIEVKRPVTLALLGLSLGSQAQVEAGLVPVPDGRDVGRVLGRLVLEVDEGDLLVELGGAVSLLLGVKVEP